MLQDKEIIPTTPNMPDNHVMARVARQDQHVLAIFILFS
jgi:hypothetical protein